MDSGGSRLKTGAGLVVGFLGLLLMVYYCALPNELPADEPGLGGLDGTYTVNGVDPNGAEYSGTVVMRRTSSRTVDIEWIVTGGIHRGSGTRTGDSLDVEWSTVGGAVVAGGRSGTATYEILDDGRLVGTRTVAGVDEVGTEEIFPDA